MLLTAFLGYVLVWGTDKCLIWLICFLPFSLSRVPAKNRIGPHNIDIQSVIIGNLLGDGWAEKRYNSSRFHLYMGSPNVEYLMWLHNFYAIRGYCSLNKPKISKKVSKINNKIYFYYRFRTWSYSSFNWIYDLFYLSDGTKRVPSNIEELITPLALAIWIMDDGGAHNSGMIISTYSFQLDEIKLLQAVFFNKFGLKSNLLKKQEGYIIYIPKNQLSLLHSIVLPYMHPSMLYKLKVT